MIIECDNDDAHSYTPKKIIMMMLMMLNITTMTSLMMMITHWEAELELVAGAASLLQLK